jgi:di/tricarboxylate transporter
MNWDAWLTLGILAATLALLVSSRIATDLAMIAALTALLVAGVITPKEALSGFSNEGMITVAVLFVIAAGLSETGAMTRLTQSLFGRPKSVRQAQARMMFPIAALSALMNNTPLVAALLPAISEWGKKFQIPLSKLMMPLSFATILGGLCTLIGTSTNVIVGGLVAEAIQDGTLAVDTRFGFFTLTAIGVPCAIAGIAYMLLASRWFLPDRKPAISLQDDPRKYTVEMMVEPNGGIAGSTIEAAGLRHLTGMYLAEVDRRGEILPAVSPTLRLEAHDRLIFVGIVDSVVELQRIRGLIPATEQVFKLEAPRSRRVLVEAVVSDRCPVVGKTIREGNFRKRYNAVVIAAARNDERLPGKIGDIVLRPGDVLLLEARPSFAVQQRGNRDFYLVSPLEDSSPPEHGKAGMALLILIAMVAAAMLFEQVPWFIQRGYSMLHAALLAAGLMLLTRCCSPAVARRAVDWPILIVIAATFGLGRAMVKSGAASTIAGGVVNAAGDNPYLVLIGVYLITMIATEVLSNNTAAVLMFPIATAAAHGLDASPLPFIVAMTIAASCGFATPVGYQTNLMVYGPGGYRFGDFLRFGGGLDLVVAAVTIALTPLVFPFY